MRVLQSWILFTTLNEAAVEGPIVDLCDLDDANWSRTRFVVTAHFAKTYQVNKTRTSTSYTLMIAAGNAKTRLTVTQGTQSWEESLQRAMALCDANKNKQTKVFFIE